MKYEIEQPKTVKVNWVGDVAFISIWTDKDTFIQVTIPRPSQVDGD